MIRACLGLAGAGLCRAVMKDVVADWGRIAAQTDGVVGAAALRLDGGQRVSLRGDDRFPLASVCKLPIAIAIFAMAGEGKLYLDDEIEIPPYDVVPGVSPIAERWPKQKRWRVDEMVELMVAKSDNTAVQTLFGWPAAQREWKRACAPGISMVARGSRRADVRPRGEGRKGDSAGVAVDAGDGRRAV